MKPSVNMDVKREFAVRLREVRLELGMSQQELADALGASRIHINRLEAPEAEKMPSQPFVKRICNFAGINENWLYYGKGRKYKRDSEVEILANEKAATLSSTIINQTNDYIYLKSSEVLKKGEMTGKDFAIYFRLFSSVMEIVFNLMSELKVVLERKHDPCKLLDVYSEQFRNCLVENLVEFEEEI